MRTHLASHSLSIPWPTYLLLPAVALSALSAEGPAMDGKARASIREDGTLLINGKPVFPVAIRIEGEGKEHQQIAEAGFNMLLGSGQTTESYYREAVRNKLWVIAGHYVWATFATLRTKEKRGVDLYLEDEAALPKVFGYTDQSRQKPLESLRLEDDHPCVFAWDICEEPPAKYVEALEQMYEIFKSNSPGHLVAALSCDSEWPHVFRNSCDVLIFDVYPYRGHKSQPAIYTYDRVRRAREELGKPVWLMPQLYPPTYWSRRPEDELTVRQMRQQNYLGLIAGAKGIVMYSYSSLWWWWKDGDRQKTKCDEALFQKRWTDVRQVVAELNQLGPIICDGRPVELPMEWFGPDGKALPPQLVRLLDYEGDLYMLVANVSDHPIQTKVRGFSRVHRNAYEVSVLHGADDVTVAQTEPDYLPLVTVAPQGSGTLLLKRRPLRPKTE